MRRKERSPEEQARRAKIRELLELSSVSSMEDIQNLFKKTIAEFMRNGHSSKQLRTSFGTVDVSVPRDRKGEFEPQQLKKNQTSISRDIEEKILPAAKE